MLLRMIFTNSVCTSAFGYIHVLPVVLVIFYLLPKVQKSKHNISKANQKDPESELLYGDN